MASALTKTLFFSLVLVALQGADAAAQGDSEGLPPGNFGAHLGLRQFSGQLGVLTSVDAGYHPTNPDSNVSLGLGWSVAWTWFGSDASNIAGSLSLLEFNLGARLRWYVRRLDSGPLYVVAGSGMSLLRANVPLPPDSERHYLGPYVVLGLEPYVVEKLLLSFEFRYGLLAGGPGGFSLAIGVGFGS